MDRDKIVIEEMAERINNMQERNAHYYAEENGKLITREAFADSYAIAEELTKYYQPKIPEDSAVISKEELLDIANEYDKMAMFHLERQRELDQARKQAIKDFIQAINKEYELFDDVDEIFFSCLRKDIKRIANEMGVVVSKEEYEALLLEQKRLKEMVDKTPCGYVKLADDEIVIKKDEYEALLAVEQKHVKAVVDRISHDNAQKEEVDHLTITSKRYILDFDGFYDTPEMLFGKGELADE